MQWVIKTPNHRSGASGDIQREDDIPLPERGNVGDSCTEVQPSAETEVSLSGQSQSTDSKSVVSRQTQINLQHINQA